MAPSFGTSGLRGLADELTDSFVEEYVTAFLVVCPEARSIFVGRDLRASSPRIAEAVIRAVRAASRDAVECGILPTPALALAAAEGDGAAIMVTGSHIPADRNGLKFFRTGGEEITKADESAITAAREAKSQPAAGQGGALHTRDALGAYAARYAKAFGSGALAGMRVGVYRHSSVAREVMERVLTTLGATAVPLGDASSFVAVDTEAVAPDTRAVLAAWCAEHRLDALISTDGDADRPMLVDETGTLIPGDVLGVLTGRHLGARIAVTPVSSNDMVDDIAEFDAVRRTRIGSPYVVAGMESVLAGDPAARVVGFEANGGFLLGFDAKLAGPLPALMTRDALLPAFVPLAAAKARGCPLSRLSSDLPPRFTAADRIQDIDRDRAAVFLSRLDTDAEFRAAFFAATGRIVSEDRTDGLRLGFESGETVHLRPSGNAPEFRVYAQAASHTAAALLVETYLDLVRKEVD